jgi:Rho-binding antiterminator
VRKIESETPYRPISCDVYSTLELAILHRQPLHVVWREDNVSHTRTLTPLDLETEAGREFLHYRFPTGEVGRIRLDRIDRVEPA